MTRPSAGAIAAAITSVILCGLCALAYWLMVAAWLYKASAKAGMNRALWPLLGLVFNLLAVLAFLILRERLAHCPVCSTWQKNGRYCVNCGTELAPLCPKCNCVCGAADRYCPFCGAALKVRHKDRAG